MNRLGIEVRFTVNYGGGIQFMEDIKLSLKKSTNQLVDDVVSTLVCNRVWPALGASADDALDDIIEERVQNE